MSQADTNRKHAADRTNPVKDFRPAIVTSLMLLGFVAGCQQPETCLMSLPEPTFHPQISVYELANRLGMNVRQINATGALLSNQANTVLLMPGAGGRAYVNGKSVPMWPGICVYSGSVWVSADLPEALQKYLVPLPRPVPRWTAAPPPTGSLIGREFHVVIDAGHGGNDPGAISVHGGYEKGINLAVARLVAERLAGRGVKVTQTRTTDVFVDLDERAAIANRIGAQFFVAIHADSSSNRRARGCTVYVCRDADDASVRAATAMVRAIARAGLSTRGLRRADYRVLTRTRCPAILVELGYLSNSSEARFLADRSGQEQLAAALAEGVLAFIQAASR